MRFQCEFNACGAIPCGSNVLQPQLASPQFPADAMSSMLAAQFPAGAMGKPAAQCTYTV